MNSNRKAVLGIAAASLALILLFSPFDQYSIANLKVPVFAGFYWYFSPPAYGVVNSSLLLLEVVVVLVNAGIGWLLVGNRPDAAGTGNRARGRIGYQNAVLIFAGINLVVIVLFPPLESVFALTNAALPSFEGFYFIFDKRPDHTIVTTLLYLEAIFILVNAALAWLIFRKGKTGALSPEEARALAIQLRGRRN